MGRAAVDEVVLAEGDEVGGDPAHEEPRREEAKEGAAST